MRIGVWAHLPPGGGKRALYDHVRGLLALGHDIEVWAPPSADRTMLDLSDLAPYHVVPYPKWRRRLAARIPWSISLPARVETMKAHCIQVAREMSEAGREIVLSSTCRHYAVSPLARYSELPSVLYLQEPRRQLYEAQPDNPWQLEGGRGVHASFEARLRGLMDTEFRRLQVREEVVNARAFDTVLVNSYFSMESVARTYGIAARVCYLGVDVDDWTPPLSEAPRYGLIGVGGFQFSKRIDLLIEAAARLSRPAPPVVWAGYGANAQYLEGLVQLARARQVDFTPYLQISHEELLRLTSAASIYCCTARLEPFGYGPLEAGAARLPVVAVAEGGFRETVVEGLNGLLVDPDPESLAAALQYLLDDDEQRQSLGDGGRKLVEERWTVASAVTRLEAELERTLARGHKRLTPAST